jgi:23S rRNA pseudouridine2605 synthase
MRKGPARSQPTPTQDPAPRKPPKRFSRRRRTTTPEDAGVRLQKYLSRAGLASRREGERLILEGRVRVNGEVVRTLGTRVVPGRDRVELDGKVAQEKTTRWVKLYKPRGVLTTRSDPEGRETVYDLLPPPLRTLRYVGRLDLLTEGLLLLTNEGETLHRITHPSSEVEREYRVWLQKEPPRGVLRQILEGVELEDGIARATSVEALGGSKEGFRISLVLTEGRNREVRRLLEVLGQQILRLKRVRFGPVVLGTLNPGSWRDLSNKEIRALRNSVRQEEQG